MSEFSIKAMNRGERNAPELLVADLSISASPRLRGESDWLLWQLSDSAFPTGGFAHSAGLEAAWQQGEVRNREELTSFLEASLPQLARSALPFVTASWHEPERISEFDRLADAFLTNHVANRASRLQGQALQSAIKRIFQSESNPLKLAIDQNVATRELECDPPFAHFAPVFGMNLRCLGISRETTSRLFFFNHVRGIIAATVRLNIIGPMEGQALQHRLSAKAEETCRRCESLTLDDLAQTAPLLDLWQGTQDRLYSRLFQS
jgi:urease accessory protein